MIIIYDLVLLHQNQIVFKVVIFIKSMLLTTGYSSCYVCGATPIQMSEPRGVLHSFIPKPGTLSLGIHPLHISMTAFNWFNKTAFHQDFRNWRCEGTLCSKNKKKSN